MIDKKLNYRTGGQRQKWKIIKKQEEIEEEFEELEKLKLKEEEYQDAIVKELVERNKIEDENKNYIRKNKNVGEIQEQLIQLRNRERNYCGKLKENCDGSAKKSKARVTLRIADVDRIKIVNHGSEFQGEAASFWLAEFRYVIRNPNPIRNM